MTSNKSIVVLTPNGRKQNIKVTPNTTIIQVLEEACKKHGFDPDDYDLKHYNQILDSNLTIRYSNLANNACLEMVPIKNPRKVSDVTICLQLTNGERRTGNFSATTNLSDILSKLEVSYHSERSVIIYMQREICGKSNFDKFDLKSLGILNGKALLRLLERDPEKSGEQAHVYDVPSTSKIIKLTEELPKSKPQTHFKSNTFDPVALIRTEKQNLVPQSKQKNDISISEIQHNPQQESSKKAETPLSKTPILLEKEKIVSERPEPTKEEPMEEEVKEEPKVEFLGERNALLFNRAAANAIHHDEIPDDFFEVTIKDAQFLMQEAIQNREKLENCPLKVGVQRELEENIAKLSCLNKYKQSIIRIHFPNYLVLQGVFGPLDTIKTVKEFVQTYLEDPESNFELYTTPPKKNLSLDCRLIDLGLVPNANIHYLGESNLKTDVMGKMTDLSAVNFQTLKTRISATRDKQNCVSKKNEESLKNGEPSSLTSTNSEIVKQDKVPKWFKPV